MDALIAAVGSILVGLWIVAIWHLREDRRIRSDEGDYVRFYDHADNAQWRDLSHSTQWTVTRQTNAIIPIERFNKVRKEEPQGRKCPNCGATAKGKCEYCGSEG